MTRHALLQYNIYLSINRWLDCNQLSLQRQLTPPCLRIRGREDKFVATKNQKTQDISFLASCLGSNYDTSFP